MKTKKTAYRPTWAEIDLNRLAFNYRQIKKAAAFKVKVLAAVKANAYGHGMVEVSRRLEKEGVDYLGVASVDEALVLRRAKVTVPILVMGIAFTKEEMQLALKYNITLTVADYQYAKTLNSQCSVRKKIKIHFFETSRLYRCGKLSIFLVNDSPF